MDLAAESGYGSSPERHQQLVSVFETASKAATGSQTVFPDGSLNPASA
jgi:hypothetical protein